MADGTKDKRELPLISVVVPVYNAERFLRATVESILAQTDPNYEVILVNDGSTDGSLALCRELEAEVAARRGIGTAHSSVTEPAAEGACPKGTDEYAESADRPAVVGAQGNPPLLRVIDQENRGVSAARNCGIREARGEYICFVDSDDLVTPGFVTDLRRGMEEAIAQGRRDVQVQIGRREVNEQGELLPDAITPPSEPTWIDPVELVNGMLLYTGDASFCTKLTPRRLLLEYPFEAGALAEDFRLQVRMTDALEGIYSLPQVDYIVLHRAGSLTRRKDIEHFSLVYISIVEAADYVEKELVLRHPELAVPAKRFALYERLDYLLHVPIADMNGDNEFYQGVVAYLRMKENRAAVRGNPYLDRKSRLYLRLLTAAPRLVRRVHRMTMKVRGIS